MSYITPPTEIAQTRRRRILIVGKSGTRKTTAILTSPKPVAIINYPGELGWDTIPDNDPSQGFVPDELRDGAAVFIVGQNPGESSTRRPPDRQTHRP